MGETGLTNSTIASSTNPIVEPPAEALVRASDSAISSAGACEICGRMLGKRRLRPRHHCRICTRLVCGACSPSKVNIEGEPGVHCSCTPCSAVAQKAPVLIGRLNKLAERLNILAAQKQGALPVDVPTQPGSLDDAVKMCEDGLGGLVAARGTVHLPRADYNKQ